MAARIVVAALLMGVVPSFALAEEKAGNRVIMIVQGPDGSVIVTDSTGKERIVSRRNAPVLNTMNLNTAERIRDSRRNIAEKSAKVRADRAEKLREMRESVQQGRSQQGNARQQMERDARVKREAQDELIRRNTPGVTSTVKKRSSRSSRYVVPRKTSPRNWSPRSLKTSASPYIAPRKTSPRNWNLQLQSIPTHLLNN